GHRQVSDGLRQQLARAEAVAQRFRQEQAALDAEVTRLAPRREELRAEAARAAEAAARDEERVLAAQAAVDRARAGLAAQPRGPRLEGVVGLVASLIHVPAELEVAVEVALGSHLQDVVVERWEHAEAAVEMLKRTRAGRATFLPLDTIRGGDAPTPPSPRGRG